MTAVPVGVGLIEAGGGQGLPEYLFVRRAVAVLAREAIDAPGVIDRTVQVPGERADVPAIRRSVECGAREA
jgi:hypothetical protein